MGAVLDFFAWLFWDSIFAFIFYTTGALILRVVSFGALRKSIFSFGVFNEHRRQARNEFSLAYLVGIMFYAVIIGVLIWLRG